MPHTRAIYSHKSTSSQYDTCHSKKYTRVNMQTCSVAKKIKYPSHQVASVQTQE